MIIFHERKCSWDKGSAQNCSVHRQVKAVLPFSKHRASSHIILGGRWCPGEGGGKPGCSYTKYTRVQGSENETVKYLQSRSS